MKLLDLDCRLMLGVSMCLSVCVCVAAAVYACAFRAVSTH